MICGNAKYFEVSSVYTEHGSIVNSNWRPVFGVFIQRGTASSLPSSQERSAISHICSVFISIIEHQFLNYVAIGFIPRLRLIDARHIRARRSKTPRKDVEDEEEESWTLPDNAKHTKNRPYSMYIFIRMKWWSHISKKKYYAMKLTRIRLIVKWIIPMCYQVLDFALTYVSELAGISRWASNSFFRVSYKFHIVFVWVSVFCWFQHL